jgi:hypothetical protein
MNGFENKCVLFSAESFAVNADWDLMITWHCGLLEFRGHGSRQAALQTHGTIKVLTRTAL